MRSDNKKNRSNDRFARNHTAARSRQALMEVLEDRTLYSAGSLDASFGINGLAVASSTLSSIHAAHAAVQADGKVVVVGRSDDAFAVARFNSNGTLDKSFGASGTGLVLTRVGDGSSAATSVAIQPNGRIVVVGTDGGQSNFDVVRYTSSGALDNSFGGTGIVRTDLGNYVDYFTNVYSQTASDVALQSNGQIVVAGSAYTTGFIGASNEDFAVVRYNSNGSVDTNFGNDSGAAIVGFGSTEFASSVAIDNYGTPATNSLYGTIVVAGTQYNSNSSQFAVARLNFDGSLDNRFNHNGKVLASLSSTTSEVAHGVVIEPSGVVVAAGSVFDHGGGSPDFVLAGIYSDGTMDQSFGSSSNGWQRTDFGGSDQANAIITGFNGDLLVGGGSNGQFAVAAYTAGGKLDPSFGAGGKVITPVGEASVVTGLAEAPGRRFVAVGSGSVFHAARYIDVGPQINVATFNPNAYEAGTQSASFLVTRTSRLPFATRVRLTLSGTARLQVTPVFKAAAVRIGGIVPPIFGAGDYTLSGVYSDANGYYVDIPANQTYAVVTLTPIDEHAFFGLKTAIFTVQNDSLYDLGTSPSVTINIHENDPLVVALPVTTTGTLKATV